MSYYLLLPLLLKLVYELPLVQVEQIQLSKNAFVPFVIPHSGKSASKNPTAFSALKMIKELSCVDFPCEAGHRPSSSWQRIR